METLVYGNMSTGGITPYCDFFYLFYSPSEPILITIWVAKFPVLFSLEDFNSNNHYAMYLAGRSHFI